MLTDFYDISQGSVVMHMRSVGIFSCPLTRYSFAKSVGKKIVNRSAFIKVMGKNVWHLFYGCSVLFGQKVGMQLWL